MTIDETFKKKLYVFRGEGRVLQFGQQPKSIQGK